MFKTAKSKAIALLVTWASLATWCVSTPHKAKNLCISKNKSLKSMPTLVYYTLKQLRNYPESRRKQKYNRRVMTAFKMFGRPNTLRAQCKVQQIEQVWLLPINSFFYRTFSSKCLTEVEKTWNEVFITDKYRETLVGELYLCNKKINSRVQCFFEDFVEKNVKQILVCKL